MHPDTRKVTDHMREFGLSLFGRSLHDSTFCEWTTPYSHAMAVVIAAQAGEILLKARISEEHPLLIFKSLPASSTTNGPLSIDELFRFGQSYGYEQLPELLWATTGVRARNINIYKEFGKLRNTIIHFGVPEGDLVGKTMKFCIEFLYPLILRFWSIRPLSYAEEWYEDIVSQGYLERVLVTQSVKISKELREELGEESRENSKTAGP